MLLGSTNIFSLENRTLHALTLVTQWESPHYFLGVTDVVEEGEWIMMDGTSFNEISSQPELIYRWSDGEPNNHDSIEHCMQIVLGQKLNDGKCSKTNSRGLCEKKTVNCT